MRKKVQPRIKCEILNEIPISSERHKRRGYYDEVIDHLLTLESHQALKVEFKSFVKIAASMSQGLRLAAKRKKITISTMPSEDHVTIWRTVKV